MQEIDIKKYSAWIDEEKSFEDVRKDLLIRGFSEEKATAIISHLNDHILSKKTNDLKKSEARQWQLAGIALLLITCSLTIYSLIASSFTFVVISGGGIVSGIAVFLNGKKLERGPSVFQNRMKKQRRF